MATISADHARLLARQNLLAIFGERDPTKRMAQMEATYAPDITFHEPGKTVSGFNAINDVVAQLLDSNPDWAFRPVGQLWVNHNLVTLEWEFGPEDQAAPVHGNDIMIINGDGQIETMYTMIKGVSDVDAS